MKTPEQIIDQISGISPAAFYVAQYFDQLRGSNEITAGTPETDEVFSQIDSRPYSYVPVKKTLAMAIGVREYSFEWLGGKSRICKQVYLNFYDCDLVQLQEHVENGGATNAEYGFRPLFRIIIDHPLNYQKTLVQPEITTDRTLSFKPADPLEVLAARVITDFLETNTTYYQRQIKWYAERLERRRQSHTLPPSTT